jgi:transposase InsO family protein
VDAARLAAGVGSHTPEIRYADAGLQDAAAAYRQWCPEAGVQISMAEVEV